MNNVLFRFQAATVSGIFFLLLYLVVSSVAQKWSPSVDRAELFEYQAILPEKKIFSLGESIRFKSLRSIHQKIDLTYHDILYCSFDEGSSFGRYSDTYEKQLSITPSQNRVDPWRYEGEIPTTPACCFTHATIRAPLPGGDFREQTLSSEVFCIE